MYTRCPHCLTVFIVGAEQLKAAHGNVRCGTCLESFDAIPHLSDSHVRTAGATGDDHTPGVVGEAMSVSEQLSATLDVVRATAELKGSDEREASPDREWDAVAGEFTPDSISEESRESPSVSASHSVSAEDEANPGRSETEPRVAVVDESRDQGDHALPLVLREETDRIAARTAAQRRNVGYGVAALTLLGLLAVQYVFFMPDDAARRYPQWRGAIEAFCVQLGCVIPERRDPARIRVVSRDVRLHPRYEGVLQIKATLTNAAPFRQPYPRVRFTLFNVNGQTIATRVFQPSEYLGRPVAAGARLRPQTPFQVALDVLAPEEAAVSFEFSFL